MTIITLHTFPGSDEPKRRLYGDFRTFFLPGLQRISFFFPSFLSFAMQFQAQHARASSITHHHMAKQIKNQ